jgi:hypothetical protein
MVTTGGWSLVGLVDNPLGVNTPSSIESKMRRLSLIAAILVALSLLTPAVAVADPNDCGYSYEANACTPNGPQGAIARCRDGSYAFSRHPTATCSKHGGVSQWLTG